MNILANPFARSRARHCVPEGKRVYAVGDIHGRSDLLDELLEMIAGDDEQRGQADTLLLFLGDLVDRGPDSRGVVERLLSLSRSGSKARFLLGNHEDMFLRAIAGDAKATRFLARFGGKETLLSYGLSERDYQELDHEALTALLPRLIPPEHVAFLSSFERYAEIGDYLFVHAGVKPGVPLEEQSHSDLCWIREDFLLHRSSFGKMVVHGHSIREEVEVRPNRIGIDTGAYATGRLTAIGLEQDQRWFLST